MHNTAIIIPAYNEEKWIADVVSAVSKQYPHVVVVDDGSSDATRSIAGEHTPHTLFHSVNLGKGGAMRTGAEYAFEVLGMERIIFIDGDGQHNTEELALFMEAFEEGHEIVFGVRNIWSKMPRSRTIGNHLLSKYIEWRYGTYVPDILSGFKGFTRTAYESIRWDARGYEVELDIAVRVAQKKLAFKTIAIETIYHDLERGMNILDALKLIARLPLWK